MALRFTCAAVLVPPLPPSLLSPWYLFVDVNNAMNVMNAMIRGRKKERKLEGDG
jgi:hypothetical protein